MVRLLHLWKPGLDSFGQVLREEPPGGGVAQHRRAVFRGISDPAAGSVPVRPDRRSRGSQVHVPHHAERHGPLNGPDRIRADLRQRGPHRGGDLVPAAARSGTVPRRRVWWSHHLRRGARPGRKAGLLHWLAADVPDARDRPVAGGHRRDAKRAGTGGVQCVGVEDPVHRVPGAGCDCDLHPATPPGDADLPGDEVERADRGQPVAGGVP